jgi:hypothetical protein
VIKTFFFKKGFISVLTLCGFLSLCSTLMCFPSPSSKFQLDMFLLFDCLEIKNEILMKYVRVKEDFLCLLCTSFCILVPKDLCGFI